MKDLRDLKDLTIHDVQTYKRRITYSTEEGVELFNNYLTEICSGSKAGTYFRLIEVGTTQL